MRNTTHKQQEIENQKAKIRSEQEKCVPANEDCSN